MLNNQIRRQILNEAKQTGFQGSVLDLFQLAEQGADVSSMLQTEALAKQQQAQAQAMGQQNQQIQQQQPTQSPTPNQAFSTQNANIPTNPSRMGEQGHLVQSFQNTPTGIQNLPGGPKQGQAMVDTPAYEDGGMRGMMKAKIAMENQFGNNPAITRMIKPTINPYDFGDGDTGTHHMGSYGKFAIPSIQDVDGTLQYTGPRKDEAIKFDRAEDATYFAKNYKDVAPAFKKKEGGYKPKYMPQPTGRDEEAVISERTFDAFKNLDVVKDSYEFIPYIKPHEMQDYVEYDGKLVDKKSLEDYKEIENPVTKNRLLNTIFDQRRMDRDEYIGRNIIKRYETYKDSGENEYKYESGKEDMNAPIFKAMDKVLPKLDTLTDTELQEFTRLINTLSSPYTEAMSENEDFGQGDAFKILMGQDLSGIKKYRKKMGLTKGDILDLVQPGKNAGVATKALASSAKAVIRLKDFKDGGYKYSNGGTLGFLSSSPLEKLKTASQYAAETVSAPFRKKIADNLYPFSYQGGVSRIINAVRGKREERDERTFTKEDPEYLQERTDLLQLHMGQDQKYNSVPESKYKPSIAKDDDVTYYTSPETEEVIKKDLKWRSVSDIDKKYFGDDESKPGGRGGVLGQYILSKGEDEKGKYVSYYDKWDFNPFDYAGRLGNKPSKNLNKAFDKTLEFFGMDAPEIYGRVYYNEKDKTNDPYDNTIKQKGGYRYSNGGGKLKLPPLGSTPTMDMNAFINQELNNVSSSLDTNPAANIMNQQRVTQDLVTEDKDLYKKTMSKIEDNTKKGIAPSSSDIALIKAGPDAQYNTKNIIAENTFEPQNQGEIRDKVKDNMRAIAANSFLTSQIAGGYGREVVNEQLEDQSNFEENFGNVMSYTGQNTMKNVGLGVITGGSHQMIANNPAASNFVTRALSYPVGKTGQGVEKLITQGSNLSNLQKLGTGLNTLYHSGYITGLDDLVGSSAVTAVEGVSGERSGLDASLQLGKNALNYVPALKGFNTTNKYLQPITKNYSKVKTTAKALHDLYRGNPEDAALRMTEIFGGGNSKYFKKYLRRLIPDNVKKDVFSQTSDMLVTPAFGGQAVSPRGGKGLKFD